MRVGADERYINETTQPYSFILLLNLHNMAERPPKKPPSPSSPRHLIRALTLQEIVDEAVQMGPNLRKPPGRYMPALTELHRRITSPGHPTKEPNPLPRIAEPISADVLNSPTIPKATRREIVARTKSAMKGLKKKPLPTAKQKLALEKARQKEMQKLMELESRKAKKPRIARPPAPEPGPSPATMERLKAAKALADSRRPSGISPTASEWVRGQPQPDEQLLARLKAAKALADSRLPRRLPTRPEFAEAQAAIEDPFNLVLSQEQVAAIQAQQAERLRGVQIPEDVHWSDRIVPPIPDQSPSGRFTRFLSRTSDELYGERNYPDVVSTQFESEIPKPRTSVKAIRKFITQATTRVREFGSNVRTAALDQLEGVRLPTLPNTVGGRVNFAGAGAAEPTAMEVGGPLLERVPLPSARLHTVPGWQVPSGRLGTTIEPPGGVSLRGLSSIAAALGPRIARVAGAVNNIVGTVSQALGFVQMEDDASQILYGLEEISRDHPWAQNLIAAGADTVREFMSPLFWLSLPVSAAYILERWGTAAYNAIKGIRAGEGPDKYLRDWSFTPSNVIAKGTAIIQGRNPFDISASPSLIGNALAADRALGITGKDPHSMAYKIMAGLAWHGPTRIGLEVEEGNQIHQANDPGLEARVIQAARNRNEWDAMHVVTVPPWHASGPHAEQNQIEWDAMHAPTSPKPKRPLPTDSIPITSIMATPAMTWTMRAWEHPVTGESWFEWLQRKKRSKKMSGELFPIASRLD